MGNQLHYSEPTDVHALLIEIPELSPEGEVLKSTKIMKSVLCSFNSTILTLAKVHLKREELEYSEYTKAIDQIMHSVIPSMHPNLLASDCFETKRVAVILRPFAENTLRQRLVKFPELSLIEKLWIAFSMVLAVFQLHSIGQAHGDIHSDNFLITSWNWVFLVDLSSYYKPTSFLESDLTTLKTYFGTHKRDYCYLAPERLIMHEEEIILTPPTSKMDVFSLGCTIAELFSEGRPLFSLSELLAFQKGSLSIDQQLGGIKEQWIVPLIEEMVCRNPSERLSINQCREKWENMLKPYFSTSLHKRLSVIVHNPSFKQPYGRIRLAQEIFNSLQKKNDYSLLVPLVTSTLRNTSLPSERVEAIELLLLISREVNDDVNLHRILPFLVSIISTKSEKSSLKVAGLNGIIFILQKVSCLEPMDAYLYSSYVWPAMMGLKHDESDWVRISLAKYLPDLAGLSFNMLMLSRSVRESSGSLAPLEEEQSRVEAQLISLFLDLIQDKQSIQLPVLRSLDNFIKFFSVKVAMNMIIPNTVLFFNRSDSLKCALFSQISKMNKDLAVYYHGINIGESLETYSENVFYYSLHCFSQIPDLITPLVLEKAVLCLMHPNRRIRSASQSLLKSAISKMDHIDNFTILRPLLMPILLIESVYSITPEIVYDHTKPPFTRAYCNEFLMTSTCLPQDERILKELKPFLSVKYTLSEEKSQNVVFQSSSSSPANREFSEKRFKASFNEHSAAVVCLAYNENNSAMYSASNDGKIRNWDLKQLENLESIKATACLDVFSKHHFFTSLASTGDSIISTYGNRACLIDANVFCKTWEVEQHSKITKALLVDENTLIYANVSGQLKELDTRTRKSALIDDIGFASGLISGLSKLDNSFALCAATAKGFLHVFDMRFNTLVDSINTAQPIFSIHKFTSERIYNNKGPVVAVGQASEVWGWDLGAQSVKFVLKNAECNLRNNSRGSLVEESAFDYKCPREFGLNKHILSRHSEYSKHADAKLQYWTACQDKFKCYFEDTDTIRSVSCPSNMHTVLSGGQDGNLTVWDMSNPSSSSILGGTAEFYEHLEDDVLVINKHSNPRYSSHKDAVLDILNINNGNSYHTLTASRDGSVKLWT